MAQDSSHSSKGRDTMRKGQGKSKKSRAASLAGELSKRFPLLGPHEWDFRWVTSKEQEVAVVAYERGREIMRLAQDSLRDDLGDSGKAKEVWTRFVTCGGLEHLMGSLKTPGASNYDLAKVLSFLMPAKHRFNADRPCPPPACEVRKIFPATMKPAGAKPALLFQCQVELPWMPDEEGGIHPDDSFASMGWGGFSVPWPSQPVLMHVPMFGVLNHEQALEQFKSWIAAANPGMFSGSGRDDESALLELAFFRFNQGRQGPKVWSRFKDALEAIKVPAGQESSTFGLGIYVSVLGRYEALSVKWSQSIRLVEDALRPLAVRLAHEAQIYYVRWLPPGHVFKRPRLDDLRKPF